MRFEFFDQLFATTPIYPGLNRDNANCRFMDISRVNALHGRAFSEKLITFSPRDLN